MFLFDRRSYGAGVVGKGDIILLIVVVVMVVVVVRSLLVIESGPLGGSWFPLSTSTSTSLSISTSTDVHLLPFQWGAIAIVTG
jgi:hypothetical protein